MFVVLAGLFSLELERVERRGVWGVSVVI
jgi:hypothetical protein